MKGGVTLLLGVSGKPSAPRLEGFRLAMLGSCCWWIATLFAACSPASLVLEVAAVEDDVLCVV